MSSRRTTSCRWVSLRSLVLGATMASVVAVAPSVRADEEKAGAQAAFDMGKKLMLEGRFGDACPKFQESLRIDPGVGTMLFLADCWEKTGKTASAWGQFREAEALASRQQDPREAVARKRADALEAKLNNLVIVMPPTLSKVEGVKVQRDGTDVGAGLWGVPIPVDPGAHKIVVTAPAKKTWSTEIVVDTEARVSQVELPEQLEDGADPGAAAVEKPAAPTTPPPPAAAPSDRAKTQRIVGLVLGGVGLVGVGVGTGFGLHAKSRDDASKADGHCDAANVCDPIGREARNDAFTAATVSTIAFGVGAAAIAAGAVLFFTAPRTQRAAAQITPWVSYQGQRGGGFTLSGAF